MPKSKRQLFPEQPVPPAYPFAPQVGFPQPIPQPPVYAPPVLVATPPQKLDPWHYSDARLLQDRNATVAKVQVVQRSSYDGAADFEFTATGSSKRERGDKFNPRTGELLALSRAYLKLSRELHSAGKALVDPETEEQRDARLDQELDDWGREQIEVDAADATALPPDPMDSLSPELQVVADAYNAAVSALETVRQLVIDAALAAVHD